jgi:hypothetical protein
VSTYLENLNKRRLIPEPVFLNETNAEVILKKRVRKMRKEKGNDKLITIYEAAYGEKTVREVFVLNMTRAAVLFFTDPSCMIIGLYMAII